MSISIGTSGYQYPEWKGTFYPEKMALAKMLPFYAERFDTTEVNYTFRHIPSRKTIGRWVEMTPERFHFSLKAPQRITHFAKLKDCADTLRYFSQAVAGLEDKLGPILFQLPPSFEKDAERLRSFLQDLPRGLRAAFEFRHPSWFDDEVFALLTEHRAALCIAESADLVTPRVGTADFGYLRLRREDYVEQDIAAWGRFLREQQSQWRETFVYFKHEESGVGPKFAQQLKSLLA